MLQSLVSPALLTLSILTFLTTSAVPLAQAQTFRPVPVEQPCSAFAEGQGLYVAGVFEQNKQITPQTFMLDLSVSWNTSNPVFKKISGGPKTDLGVCVMTKDGEDLFIRQSGVGYMYNVRSAEWSTVHSNNFGVLTWSAAATDPTSGLVYFPTDGEDFTGKELMLVMDPKTKTFKTAPYPTLDTDVIQVVTWSAPLKSMVIFTAVSSTTYLYTPSKANEPLSGWGTLGASGLDVIMESNCVVSAYGGSKVILLGTTGLDFDKSNIYILDVTTRKWTKGPSTPVFGGSACAVTGDQFIIWGGEDVNVEKSDKTLIYNIKTKKWVTNFIAPSRPTTTSPTSQPSPTSTQQVPVDTTTPNPSNMSSSDDKAVTIIIIVTGALMAALLTTISVYIGLTKRSSAGSRGPSDSLSERSSESAYSSTISLGASPFGSLPEHPHAIVVDSATKRNVQEGALEAQLPQQHPHAMVKQEVATMYDGKEELKTTDENGLNNRALP
ncbi:MAG: hypothetical protein J3Q66DRAFT_422624 [Benniella sp.]|nr:MAG: hypothetical protein J3Q66DRAFT_422624 [Benniella sp.]